MPMNIRTIILIISTCLISACSETFTDRRTTRIGVQLEGIDRMMEIDPEKVLKELDSIPRGKLSADDSAYYALLYTQAMIRCGIPVSSDSLIRTAYDRYSSGKYADLKKRSCFYNAMIAFNKGDMPSAMKDAMEAYYLAVEEKSPLWIARSSELIGDIFYFVYNYRQAEPYKYEAAANYLIAGKTANHRYALCDLASVYLNENKTDKALSMLDSLTNAVGIDIPLDSALLSYISMARMSGLFNAGTLDNTYGMVTPNVDTVPPEDVGVDLYIISSRMSYNSGDTSTARALLDMAHGMSSDERQTVRVGYETFLQSLHSGDFRDAALLADTLLLLQGKIAEEILKESVTGIQRDFYSEKARYQEQRSAYIMRLLVIVVVAAMMMMVLLVWIYRLKLRTRKAELETNLLSIIKLKDRIGLADAENGRLTVAMTEQSAAMEELFRESWKSLNMLCNEYFNIGESEATRISVLNNIGKELDRLRSKKNLKHIETAVDTYMGNIMSMLRRECSFLKEEDFVLLSLLFAGLSVRAICILLNMNYKLVYLKKSRLSKRIMASDAPHKELFVSRIN